MSWREALRLHGLDTLWATAWAVSVFALSPSYFWWLTPIVAALLLAIPVSALTSRVTLGDRARAAGLFLTPEETAPPAELVDVGRELARAAAAQQARPAPLRAGFARAVVDPVVNAVHCALLGRRRVGKSALRAARRGLAARALADGPNALDAAEKRTLLADLEPMIELHRGVWQTADAARVARWGI
jgi:membrane glycosyltransferase